MRMMIFTLALISTLCTASAQESSDGYSWSVTAALKSTSPESVTCTMIFPNEPSTPRLRVIVERSSEKLGGVRLEARGVSKPEVDAGSNEVAVLTVGRSVQESEIGTSWRSSNDGSLRLSPKTSTVLLLDAIARSSNLSFETGSTRHDYSLAGSYRAVNALKNCLAS